MGAVARQSDWAVHRLDTGGGKGVKEWSKEDEECDEDEAAVCVGECVDVEDSRGGIESTPALLVVLGHGQLS